MREPSIVRGEVKELQGKQLMVAARKDGTVVVRFVCVGQYDVITVLRSEEAKDLAALIHRKAEEAELVPSRSS